ncbi:MAG: DUF5123 domain-containing protein [Prolixibacteraceae bacterium]|nr:DUF5123 domain-containing protein [Prolixibacteraceae bacterium]MBN2774218.1 DUF5123 domain-containing protein [Prolixibacteraceae bacterium]
MEKLNIKAIILLLVSGLIVMIACNKEEDFPRTRLFQPVLNEDLYSVDNTIIVNLGNMKEAQSYTIEVSRDSFLTTLYSFSSDTNLVVIDKNTVGEDLLWFTVYQVQATAHADDALYDSKPSFLGSVRTAKFPSNMGTPTLFDILDTRARVFWTPAGASITSIKVFAGDDERLTNPLAEYELTVEEQAAHEKIVGGLTAATSYQIAIYSGETLRGWEIYNTREAFVSGDNVLDLSGIDTVVNLAAVLPDVADGTIVILEGGKTYLAGGYAFDKSISFVAGYSFTPSLPVIDCSTNFNLSDGANVDYVTFKDIHLTAPGGFGSRYVFNIDQSGTMGEIKFESCVIRTLRGICRMKGGDGTLDKYTFYDCRIDSIYGYALLSVDKNTWQCNDILLQNSTISKTQYFLVSRNNSNSVVIDGCTINEAPEKGRQLFRWRESGQDDVFNGVTITNTIIGHGWNMTGETDFAIDGFDGMANTNWTIVNSYTTADFTYGVGKDEIPGLPVGNYSGTVEDLWVDPANADFNFKDTGFAGKGDSGDPRWRIGL